MHTKSPLLRLLTLSFSSALVALLLTGCLVGPKYQKPPAMTQAPPAAYKETPGAAGPGGGAQANATATNATAPAQAADAGEWKVAQPQDAMLKGKWWEIYKDDELNALEEKLNIDNQTIKVYFANFMEARTLVAEARSQLYPTVTAGPNYTRSRASANQTNTPSAATGRTTSLGSLGLDASWEPDLWGRVRNQIRAQQYNAQVSAADLENVRLSEQASLAEYFFEIRGQDALMDVYRQTVADDQKALDLTRSEYETGVGDEISVVEAQNTLQNAQSTLTSLGVARAQYEHAIAVLTGSDPSAFSIAAKALSASPPAVPIGVPSQLLERRPDIAASERTMAEANAEIGVAQSAFYPNLTLTTDGGFESATFKHLFDISSRFWSLGGSASETLFDAGLRRAAVRQYTAIYDADVAGYRQTVLTAFQQVEDALAAERILSQQIGQQEQAAQSAQKFVDLETARYETGVDPYIDVVTAQGTLLADRQTLATLHTQEMTASVQLIEALGGGWDSTQLATPEQVSKKLGAGEIEIQR
ncbi:MAG: efflux transporter outer membrane subunit [Acidobacteriaceae bacterium]|jgi:NodT family efflux transporter outer membrane factor (OMF) lipoprotein